MLKPSLIAKTDAKASNSQIYIGDDYRVTVLTNRLIRFEFSKKRHFVDLPSHTVWFRKFYGLSFSVKEEKGFIIVETPEIRFYIKRKNGAPDHVEFIENGRAVKCNNSANFKGTRRTLDMTFGSVSLDDGLITENGVYVLDDSDTILIDEKGVFTQRSGDSTDLYIFAYGKNYRETIKAFYQISSPVPLVPRFALGVWWSRYRRYTQKEYQDLMLRFKAEDIPLTVATVDMDWHWVDIKEKFKAEFASLKGKHNKSGWTGYSWNSDLFPDYKGFLQFLKKENLHITLNLHPADGVRFFEDMYADFTKAVGVDPESKADIPFVCGSDKFWNAYFDVIHKPYEKDGVDFWWIDWQQGKKSDVKGLDPLNALNHYHYLDNAENGDIPLILSRYGGLGSHRYPLGFSGDTAISWQVLDFQPYFTANAANAAYTWWSHDIGGHHMGERDDEMYLRWLQFGVFSPIMRLHSTQNDLLGKEPWKYRSDVYKASKEYLRLRHELIPYIYTMDYRTHKEGIALCEPMYYSYPDKQNAYKFKNQYMFGTELMVCPITKKSSDDIGMGEVTAWIPEGRWTDIFTGQSYKGNKVVTLNRDIDSIPVLAKEGAIIPFAKDKGNDSGNPEMLELWVYSGNNSFTLYEDNGKTDFETHNCKTNFSVQYDGEAKRLHFSMEKPEGEAVIPQSRTLRLVFKDIDTNDLVCDNAELKCDGNNAVIEFTDVSPEDSIDITLMNAVRKSQDKKERIIYILSRWQTGTLRKSKAYLPFQHAKTTGELRKALSKTKLSKAIASAIREALETL